MTRRISALFVLLMFMICIVGASAFAANKTGAPGVNPKDIISLSQAQVPVAGADDPNEVLIAKPHSRIHYPTAAGFNILSTIQVGTSYMDYQNNGSATRRIAVGCGGLIHNWWMQKLSSAAGVADRFIDYVAHLPSAAVPPASDISDPAGGGGYTCGDVDPSGIPVIGWHRVAANGTQATKDFACNNVNFTVANFGTVATNVTNCSGIETGASGALVEDGIYIWPYVCADTLNGQTIAHMVSTESPAPAPCTGCIQSVVYYRSTANVAGNAGCPVSPKFIDSVYDIAPVICQDPKSDKVAIVFTKPRAYMADGGQNNNDVCYYESQNAGTTWGTIQNVSQYLTGEIGRAYTDVSAMYTHDGCLHVLWNAPEYDSVGATVTTQACHLWHWDDCGQCRSLLLNASEFRTSCGRGAWNRNVSKMTLSECVRTASNDTLLYAVYTRFTSDDAGSADCSAAGWANGEIYAQASSTKGLTWGPPTNLTNTTSNGCTIGNCNSEHWSSSAMYVTDSVTIQYMLDKDAGGVVQTEGGWTENPVMNLRIACFSMSTFRALAAAPSDFLYPFHSKPSTNTDTLFVVQNSGNAPAPFTVTVTYASGSGWLTFPGGTSFTCGAGCTNTQTVTMRATGPGTQGLYQATVHINYTAKDAQTVTDVAVDLYNFDPFYLPQNADIRTSLVRLRTQQHARVAAQAALRGMNIFSDTSNYLFDGSVLTGRSTTTVSTSIFQGGSGTPDPALHHDYANSDITADSTVNAFYRTSHGLGTNYDSSLAFDVNYYAPKHPDTTYTIIASIKVTPGPKNPATPQTGVTVAWASDWDIPSDTGSDNTSYVDASLQMVAQRGAYAAPNTNRIGAMIGLAGDNTPISGGMVLDNPTWIYPHAGYKADSIWNKIQAQGAGIYTAFTDSTTDLNSMLILTKGATIPVAGKTWYIILIVSPKTAAKADPPSFAKTEGCKGLAWGKAHVPGMSTLSLAACVSCQCGDANGDGSINISDAVFLIQYIFAGGPAPNPLCRGDANGDGSVNISDAVYLIQYIFAGGPAPHCP